MNIPFEEIEAAIEENTMGLGNIGFCLACGEQSDGCEPDAEKYVCDSCGAKEVYGAEQILILGRVA